MHSSSYERLPQQDEARNQTASSSSRTESPASFASRPTTYYGDGPFDPPSSEDEDEDNESGSLLEKIGPSSPSLAELGDGFPSGSGRGDSPERKVRAVMPFVKHERS